MKKSRVITKEDFNEFHHLILKSIEYGQDCYFCRAAHGTPQWILQGVGLTYICPSCVEAGKVYPMELLSDS